MTNTDVALGDQGCASGGTWIFVQIAATGLALAGNSGLRATVPLFAMGVAHYATNFELAEGTQWVAHPVMMVMLGILILLEVGADLSPAVDQVVCKVLAVVRLAGGALASIAPLACAGNWMKVVMGVVGALVSLVAHSSKAKLHAIRPPTTGGPDLHSAVYSVLATCAVGGLTWLSVLYPLAGFILGLGFIPVMFLGLHTQYTELFATKRETRDRSLPSAQAPTVAVPQDGGESNESSGARGTGGEDRC